jgi:hypothetical protein
MRVKAMAALAVAEIGSSPRERGRQHGRQLKALVRERDRRWRAEIESYLSMPADRFIDRFLAETRFIPAIERHAPDLLDEVHGIAEGADLAYDAVLAAQFMDEEWWYSLGLRPRQDGENAQHCSGLASLAPGGGALLAQNMDLARWSDGLQALLLIRDAAPRYRRLCADHGRHDRSLRGQQRRIGAHGEHAGRSHQRDRRSSGRLRFAHCSGAIEL